MTGERHGTKQLKCGETETYTSTDRRRRGAHFGGSASRDSRSAASRSLSRRRALDGTLRPRRPPFASLHMASPRPPTVRPRHVASPATVRPHRSRPPSRSFIFGNTKIRTSDLLDFFFFAGRFIGFQPERLPNHLIFFCTNLKAAKIATCAFFSFVKIASRRERLHSLSRCP